MHNPATCRKCSFCCSVRGGYPILSWLGGSTPVCLDQGVPDAFLVDVTLSSPSHGWGGASHPVLAVWKPHPLLLGVPWDTPWDWGTLLPGTGVPHQKGPWTSHGLTPKKNMGIMDGQGKDMKGYGTRGSIMGWGWGTLSRYKQTDMWENSTFQILRIRAVTR